MTRDTRPLTAAVSIDPATPVVALPHEAGSSFFCR